MPPVTTLTPDLLWLLLFVPLLAGVLVGWLLGWPGRGRERAAQAERDSVRVALAQTETELAIAQAGADRVPALEDRLVAADRLAAHAERVPGLETELARLRQQVLGLTATNTRLAESQRKTEEAHADKLSALTALRADVEAKMKALADAALRDSQSSLLEVAKQLLESHKQVADADLQARQGAIDGLVKPVAETLEKYQAKLAELESATAERYGVISNELRNVVQGQESVRGEAARLVNALRAAPKTRGRWGEQQLRRALELSGMSEHVDFDLEHTVEGDDGGRLRPDAVLRLPGGRSIVIDAKTSLAAYLEALEAGDDAAREAKMADHARQMRSHVSILAGKAYWAQFKDAPDFVAMFVPGENFYSAAVERDAGLFDDALRQRVLVVTPTTLIALAKAVAYGWRQQRIEENARRIGELGHTLYDRLARMSLHLAGVGRGLDNAVGAYNDYIGSLESRVLPAARQLRDLAPGESARDLAEVTPIDARSREARAEAELKQLPVKSA
ncbi:MAG TPA: DNA recombination protein RmuC [Vineibacter sp.]|nr:DNA recombination protein RmuC [Vineibacter sp.]